MAKKNPAYQRPVKPLHPTQKAVQERELKRAVAESKKSEPKPAAAPAAPPAAQAPATAN